MGSQTLDILRQGIWASLTGGWFYDPQHGVFANTFHLYLFAVLLCLPFSIYLYFPAATFSVWSAYIVTVLSMFASIKFFNVRLHAMFDTQECIEEEVGKEDEDDDDNHAHGEGLRRSLEERMGRGTRRSRVGANAVGDSQEDGIEMKVREAEFILLHAVAREIAVHCHDALGINVGVLASSQDLSKPKTDEVDDERHLQVPYGENNGPGSGRSSIPTDCEFAGDLVSQRMERPSSTFGEMPGQPRPEDDESIAHNLVLVAADLKVDVHYKQNEEERGEANGTDEVIDLSHATNQTEEEVVRNMLTQNPHVNLSHFVARFQQSLFRDLSDTKNDDVVIVVEDSPQQKSHTERASLEAQEPSTNSQANVAERSLVHYFRLGFHTWANLKQSIMFFAEFKSDRIAHKWPRYVFSSRPSSSSSSTILQSVQFGSKST